MKYEMDQNCLIESLERPLKGLENTAELLRSYLLRK